MERARLYERINLRVEKMFASGAVEEVKRLLKFSLSLTAEKIIGIAEIKGYLAGEYSQEEAKNLMTKNTRHFAKRQVTWFKRDKRIEWVDVSGNAKDLENNILNILE